MGRSEGVIGYQLPDTSCLLPVMALSESRIKRITRISRIKAVIALCLLIGEICVICGFNRRYGGGMLMESQ